MNKKTFYFIFCYLLLCCLVIELKFIVSGPNRTHREKAVAKPVDKSLNKSVNNLDMSKALKQAFEEGYFNGRNSYIAQVNDKSYEYTSFVKKYDNLSECQIKMLESENQRGYLEGYHKATAEFSCPIE